MSYTKNENPFGLNPIANDQLSTSDVVVIGDNSDSTCRAKSISVSELLNYLNANLSFGVGSVTSVNGNTGVVVLDSDDISEGVTNLYLTASERSKIFGIESNATADQTGAEIVTSINDELGSTDWQSGGPGGSGDAWDDAVDADIVPDADGTRDLGSSANRFAELHIDSFEVNGSQTVSSFSGSDTTVITGTSGATDELAVWNADGDVVGAGVFVTTGTPAKGSSLFANASGVYTETVVGANDQKLVTDSAQTTGVKYVDDTFVFNVILDGGGSAIADGTQVFLNDLPAFTITQVTLTGDVSGSIVVDIDVDTFANFPPTSADSITASATPTLSSAQSVQDSTLTGWTTSVPDGSSMRIYADGAATTITQATLTIRGKRTY